MAFNPNPKPGKVFSEQFIIFHREFSNIMFNFSKDCNLQEQNGKYSPSPGLYMGGATMTEGEVYTGAAGV